MQIQIVVNPEGQFKILNLEKSESHGEAIANLKEAEKFLLKFH